MSKTSDESQVRDILQSIWSIFLKIVKIIKNTKVWETLNSLKEPKETWWLNAMWCPRRDFGTEKDIR